MMGFRKFLQYGVLICLFVVLASEPAYADDVFQTIKGRAVAFLVGLKPVIFILAGFGLIGFAWMAVFGQISWKWFANIAMGLFLVANMGIFIDYFATKAGNPGQYAKALGVAVYKDNLGAGYQSTSGTAGDPGEQSSLSDEGTGGASSSDQLESELDKKIQAASSEQECTAAGGVWGDNSCSKSGSSSMSDEEAFAEMADWEKELAQHKDQASCEANGGTWWNNECKASWAVGNNGTSYAQRDECVKQGGTWDGQKCTQPTGGGDSAEDKDAALNAQRVECAQNGGTWDESKKTCASASDLLKEELAAQDCASRGGIYKNGKCEESCPSGQAMLRGQCVDKAKADCYNGVGWSYTEAWGCLTQDEYQNKRANEKRRCESMSGYEWVDDKSDLRGAGKCQKTKKAGAESCKIMYGDDYEFNYAKQECQKKESALKKECEQDKNKVYKNGKCITKAEDCTSGGKVWDNGKCISQKEACEKDSNKVYKNGKCITKEQDCTSGGKVWDNGKCISQKESCEKDSNKVYNRSGKCVTKEQDCTDGGKVWDNGQCISKKEACLKTPGYFWSTEYSKCIKEEAWN